MLNPESVMLNLFQHLFRAGLFQHLFGAMNLEASLRFESLRQVQGDRDFLSGSDGN